MPSETLRVCLHGNLIGHLLPSKNGMVFRYEEEIADTKLGSPFLSTALTVKRDPFDAATTRNWFSGLLPEDSRLIEVRRFFGIEEADYSLVLKQVGWECAGAVTVFPEEGSSPQGEAGGILQLTHEELAARLCALPSHPFDNASALRISLGGYQEKLCVVLDASVVASGGREGFQKVGLPLNGSISTHILKPQPERFPGMIEGEAWAMAVASCATSTAGTSLLRLENAPETLIVERFDRIVEQGNLRRIHQEDGAQAMNLSPLQKYAASGSPKKSDPSYQRIAALLSQYSYDPAIELERLLLQMYVNVCLGNTDAHAKNFGLLHCDESTVSLTPMYDVVPALEITPQVTTMGMRIGGRIRIDRIGYEQIESEARSWGLPTSVIESALSEATANLKRGVEIASELYPEAGQRHAAATLKRLEALRP